MTRLSDDAIEAGKRECERLRIYLSHRILEAPYEAMRQHDLEVKRLRAVANAARGLALGTDWNNGTMAKTHGYRRKLLNALAALNETRPVSEGARNNERD